MKWILIQYELPNEPSKYRVWVWRRLKKQSAYKLLDGLYCLPFTDNSLERFNWICVEIEKMGGKAMLWSSEALLPGQEAEITKKKSKIVEQRYKSLYDEIKKIGKENISKSQLENFSRKWADIMWHNPNGHPLGEVIRELLTEIRVLARRNLK
ncbi:MAG: hypothetical protein J7L77_06620 [Clostridiales bacterium]|nr:hypothetical protein [Clostridiales bacterium]